MFIYKKTYCMQIIITSLVQVFYKFIYVHLQIYIVCSSQVLNLFKIYFES